MCIRDRGLRPGLLAGFVPLRFACAVGSLSSGRLWTAAAAAALAADVVAAGAVAATVDM